MCWIDNLYNANGKISLIFVWRSLVSSLLAPWPHLRPAWPHLRPLKLIDIRTILLVFVSKNGKITYAENVDISLDNKNVYIKT